MGRFYIDMDKEQLADSENEMYPINFRDKVDFYELCEFLNKQEMEKLDYKRRLKTLIYRIKILLGAQDV